MLIHRSDDFAGIPPTQRQAMLGRYKADPLWQRDQAYKTSSDLHDHVAAILSGKQAALTTVWKLTDRARHFLEKANLNADEKPVSAEPHRQIILHLSKAARKRIEAAGISAQCLKVTPGAVRLHLFNTGHGVLSIDVTFGRKDGLPLAAIELLEGQIALGRVNRLNWRVATELPENEPTLSRKDEFSLGTLLRRLALGPAIETRSVGRAFTHTFAVFGDPLPAAVRDAFALHVARHYSSEYLLVANARNWERIADFDDVRHTVSLEGVATIIGRSDGTPNNEFVSHYRTTTLKQHYSAAAILAVHEHGFLVERTTKAVQSASKGDEIAALEDLRRESLRFRTQFHFANISYIAMHNAFWHALRQVMGCDLLLRQLQGDVVELSAYLAAKNEESETRRRIAAESRNWWAGALGSSTLAALTGFTVVKEMLEASKGLQSLFSAFGKDGKGVAILFGV
jgi:hypothetical protein